MLAVCKAAQQTPTLLTTQIPLTIILTSKNSVKANSVTVWERYKKMPHKWVGRIRCQIDVPFVADRSHPSLSTIRLRRGLLHFWSFVGVGRFRLGKKLKAVYVNESTSGRLESCLKAECGLKEHSGTLELTLNSMTHYGTMPATRLYARSF